MKKNILNFGIVGFFLLLLPFEQVLAQTSIYRSNIETEDHKIEFSGFQAGEQFGSSIGSGDINGDGYDDLIIGSPYYSSDDMVWNGKVSVYFGRGDLKKRVYGGLNDFPNLVVFGRNSGDQLGISVASGDFNNDGYDDLLIGAHNAYSGDVRSGGAFLIMGRSVFNPSFVDLAFSSADVEFFGQDDAEGFGLSVDVGDINNNGVDDIIVGAPFGLSIDGVKTGKAYGYYGWTFNVDSVDSPFRFFGNKASDVIFIGLEKGERFGSNVLIGDVVGGNYDDIIISAYFASGQKGVQTGKVYIYKGLKKYSRYERVPYNVLVGENSYDWFGFSVDVSSANKYSKKSLIVSSFPYLKKSSGGKTYVLTGRSDFSPDGSNYLVNEETANYYFSGKNGENLLGASVALADLDGDGLNDFVIGAPGVGSVSSVDSGEVYIYYQKYLEDKVKFNVGDEDMISRIFGENPDDWFGAKITKMDFNGDGIDDIVISSRYSNRFDYNGETGDSDVGKVYLIFGNSAPIGEYYFYEGAEDVDYVTRGEALKTIIEKFNIKTSRKTFIDSCYQHRDFCFFAFSGQSSFSGLKLEPHIVLYPDVPVSSPYYEAITIATMLGVVNGFGGESNSPFMPNRNLTRIHALKIILSITQLVEPVYKFQLVEMLGGGDALKEQDSFYKDIVPLVSHMWWYPRFTNFAYENGLVSNKLFFRPEDYITRSELDYMIDQTLKVLRAGGEVVYADNLAE